MAEDLLDSAVRTLTDPAALMNRIAAAALELIEPAEGSVVELAAGDEMIYAYTAGALRGFIGLRLKAKGSLSGMSVDTGTTLYCEDSETDPRVDREACRRVGARSLVCVPLRSAARPVGVLKVTSPLPRAFADRHVATLAGLSAFITAAITANQAVGGAAGRALEEAVHADGREAENAYDTSVFIARVLHSDMVVEDLEVARRVRDVLDGQSFVTVHQPIYDLESGDPVISEALTRFVAEPIRPPDFWFREAWRVGLGAELELATATTALRDLDRLPEGCRLALNCSPSLLDHPAAAALASWPQPSRLVIEITEHHDAEDFDHTRRLLSPLRRQGLKIAMDDAGNGYSSLNRLIELAPDIIKLDFSLVHGLHHDPVRRSLALAIVSFAEDVAGMVVAEGIETAEELDALRRLGVRYGQGYLLGRPGPVERVAGPTPLARVHATAS